MKRDLKKVFGLMGLFTSLYAGAASIYPQINNTKVNSALIAAAAGISAWMDTTKKPPKSPKLPG